MLVNGVLRNVEQITGRELPARRLLRDARVVAVIDLGLDVPLEAMAAARDHVDGLVGHVPVLRRPAAGRDLLLIEVEAVRARVGALLVEDPAHPAIARGLPLRVGWLDDLLLGFPAGTPELRPLLPRTEACLVRERRGSSLLDEAEDHPRRLCLHHQRERALGRGAVVVLVLAVGVDDDEVVLLPLVALAVVDLVALAFEDVEVRLVLMAVAVIETAGEQLDEVDLERLREERLVAGAE